jgi:hypothetical protein
MGADSDSADHYESDVAGIERLKKGAKIEFAQRALAAPLIALICLQSE